MATVSTLVSSVQPRHPHPARFWLGRIALGLLTALFAAAASGFVYQTLSTDADRRAYPPPGALFDVGGFKMHIYCTGPLNTGNPTVILETLSGGTSAYWGWVQPEIARTTRVCSYDRAGWGWSEPSPQPPTLEQTARDLHTLLSRAGVAGPYVLVGHSIGGLHIRKFAADYPAEVAGLVFVDASHPDQFVRYPALAANDGATIRLFAVAQLLARFGVARLYLATGHYFDFGELPASQRAEIAAEWSTPDHFASEAAAISGAPAIFADAHTLGALGDLPVAVVTRGTDTAGGWALLQDELAALSTNSAHITVAGATHVSLIFDPQNAQIVSSVILQTVEAARTGAALSR